ncbi:MAG: SUMF1/EgtB/PvdO family nonheme iron enzyme [Lentimicrobiaceae bacterium]|nr:SUMF1/EgtB/PvdO family nonheme iron enzyme [Lentimicrobiaceae bacterium]
MKNFFKLIVVAILGLSVMVACKDKNVTHISLDPNTLTINVDQTEILTVSVFPEDAINKEVTWESSNHDVAVVNRGSVTGKGEGVAIITVTTNDGNFQATCTVNVTLPDIFYEPELVFVQGGNFFMGCTAEQGDECEENETPTHEVRLNDFQIGRFEVTQKEWVTIMGYNPSANVAYDLPVEKVSWEEVQEYIKKLNELTGKNYRLPTEAEWEYAARGGQKSKKFKYCGSHAIDEVAWCAENSVSTHPVGSKTPNELEIFDMSGNVWEWCRDWYGDYDEKTQSNPVGPLTGENRIIRGGSYNFASEFCRISYRGEQYFDFKGSYIGFRLVLPFRENN